MASSVPYGGEDPANKFWYGDGRYQETTVTCEFCPVISDLICRSGRLLCTWHRTGGDYVWTDSDS